MRISPCLLLLPLLHIRVIRHRLNRLFPWPTACTAVISAEEAEAEAAVAEAAVATVAAEEAAVAAEVAAANWKTITPIPDKG